MNEKTFMDFLGIVRYIDREVKSLCAYVKGTKKRKKEREKERT